MKIHWKIAMFVAMVGMLLGTAISLYGIEHNNLKAAWMGFMTVGAVCVSWWCWVMFVIRTMVAHTIQTEKGLAEIKQGISEVKSLVKDYKSLTG